MTGTVKWFDRKKGFGFIIRDDQQPDAYVHHTAIQSKQKFKELQEGDRVQFEVVPGNKGPRADKVTVLRAAPAVTERLNGVD